ncbi:MAG: hypothetical protein J6C94_05020 [Alistipes sp.]|nr:hypothetical protein [Alistipes sp.]
MKTVTRKRVYATPDFEINDYVVEAGFAISYDPNEGTEGFGKYEDTEL